MGKFSLKHYSSLWMNLFFTFIQIYGLLLLSWSGLYIIYLAWIELFFLSLFSAIRFWQLVHTEEWISQEEHPAISIEPKKAKQDFVMFVFMRVVYLSLYLLLIGVTVVPMENTPLVDNYREVKSIGQFFENLMITDPLFIVAVFFIVFYYLKLTLAKIDTSEAGLVEFSFNLNPYDLRILSPFIALAFLPIEILLILVMKSVLGIDELEHSNTYMFAVWLLVTRTLADIYLIYRIKKEFSRRGL